MGFLRQIFGPSRDEVWQRLAREVDGHFVEGRVFGEGTKVEVRVNQWTITLDTYVVSAGKTITSYTRMRAPYVNKDGFRFAIAPEGLFGTIGKLFGAQDVTIGHPEFDRRFVIKGNDETKVRALFTNPRIRDLIDAQASITLRVLDDEGWFGPDFPEGVDELQFVVGGVITDIPRLKQLYELFAEVLNHLCHIGSAYEDDPGVAVRS